MCLKKIPTKQYIGRIHRITVTRQYERIAEKKAEYLILAGHIASSVRNVHRLAPTHVSLTSQSFDSKGKIS